MAAFVRTASAVVVVLTLAACDRTNWEPSLFRTVDNESTLVTDAKQRLVINQGARAKRMICAEPSPDVTQALSEAIKFARKISTDQNPGGSVQFAHNFASSISQLGERLAVIQLFRDRMYRACEAYANGAVNAVSYTLMMARNDKTMATLLSAEMTAGAFGRTLARLGNRAATEGADPEERAELQQRIEQLTNELLDIAKRGDAARVDATAQKLVDAHTALLAMDLAAARTVAPGVIEGRVDLDTMAVLFPTIAEIHTNYLDDPGLEPLTDACLTALTTIPELATDQAKVLSEAITSRNEAVELLSQTPDEIVTFYLREKLREGTLSAAEKNYFGSLSKKNGGQISNEERSKMLEASKAKLGAKLHKAKVDVARVMLEAGNPFAAFCVSDVFGHQSGSGYISTLIKARKELRTLRKPSEAEIKLEGLKACQGLIAKLENLTADLQARVLTMCEPLLG